MANSDKPQQGLKQCIFCQDRVKMSGEHMWADWLRDYIPRITTRHLSQATLVHLDREESVTRTHAGDAHSRRLWCVCDPCNTGWMSRLQNDAKPFLVPMLTGNEVRLHRRAQTILAAWCAMTVMVAEHADRDHVAIPQADRTFLWDNGRAPSHWRIWIGRHRRTSRADMYRHRALEFSAEKEIQRVPREGGMTPNTQTSTICLGEHLLIHAMSSTVAWSIVRRWKLPVAVAPHMSQIWRVKGSWVDWPPPITLDDDWCGILAEQFFIAAQALLRDRHSK